MLSTTAFGWYTSLLLSLSTPHITLSTHLACFTVHCAFVRQQNRKSACEYLVLDCVCSPCTSMCVWSCTVWLYIFKYQWLQIVSLESVIRDDGCTSQHIECYSKRNVYHRTLSTVLKNTPRHYDALDVRNECQPYVDLNLLARDERHLFHMLITVPNCVQPKFSFVVLCQIPPRGLLLRTLLGWCSGCTCLGLFSFDSRSSLVTCRSDRRILQIATIIILYTTFHTSRNKGSTTEKWIVRLLMQEVNVRQFDQPTRMSMKWI